MGFGRYRFRRSFGQVKAQFRGARPKFYPLFTGLLDTYAGAAAAYSLRRLSKIASSVVRVRRASDNAEKDFTADNITDGAMVNWVNGQIVPPLDIRELDANGERTGDLVEAAAAYSLRNLSSSYTGNVVDVRRSSDGAEDSFTASDVADGTLEDWVNEDVTVYQSDFSSGSNGWDTSSVMGSIGNQDGVSDGVTSKDNVVKLTKLQDSQSYTQRNQGVVAGLTYTVSGSVYTPSTNNHVDSLLIKDGYSGGSISDFPSGYLESNGVWTDFSFNYTATVSGSQRINLGISSSGSSPNSSVAGSTGDVLYIADLRFVQTTSNGFVSKWYDQSGNANHATQGTDASQPKIVDGGSLVTGGIDFDGSNDGLSVSGQVLTSSSFYAASVVQHATGTTLGNVQTIHGQYQAATSGRFQLSANNSSEYAFFANATDGISGLFTGAIGTSQTLISANGDGSNAEIWRDGTSKATDTYSGFTPATVDFTIGNDSDGEREFNGKIAEIIIYPSDQSDNRTAIEANIGETYSIDLPSGVDTGYDQVDGFVETWYDQSGNGNDAVQQVSGSQPKIVDGGVLVSGGLDFDGLASYLNLDSALNLVDNCAIFSAITTSTTLNVAAFLSRNNNAQGVNIQSNGFFSRVVGSGSSGSFGFSSNTNEKIVSALTSNESVTAFQNGTASSDNPKTESLSNNSVNQLGGNGNGSNYWPGTIQEIILYPSDQSANRVAIETNINDHYDIYA